MTPLVPTWRLMPRSLYWLSLIFLCSVLVTTSVRFHTTGDQTTLSSVSEFKISDSRTLSRHCICVKGWKMLGYQKRPVTSSYFVLCSDWCRCIKQQFVLLNRCACLWDQDILLEACQLGATYTTAMVTPNWTQVNIQLSESTCTHPQNLMQSINL